MHLSSNKKKTLTDTLVVDAKYRAPDQKIAAEFITKQELLILCVCVKPRLKML
jgi:hypothetical protein